MLQSNVAASLALQYTLPLNAIVGKKIMRLFKRLFGRSQEKDEPELLWAIDRAIDMVEPKLRQAGDYRKVYREPVRVALEYARSLAARVPGPVAVNRETFVSDPFVHALFPTVDNVSEAFCASMAVHNYYRDFPETHELFALMGMRRFEKKIMGMELADEIIQQDVMQKAVYFTSHTIECLASTEEQARRLVALSFFDSLVGKVKMRIDARKQEWQSQVQEKNLLTSRLRSADAAAQPALEKELFILIACMQSKTESLNLSNYIEDFEAVLLTPEQHLHLNQVPILMDSMGISHGSTDTDRDKEIIFCELVDFDRRNWTITMVHCSKMKRETFEHKMEKAHRRLSI